MCSMLCERVLVSSARFVEQRSRATLDWCTERGVAARTSQERPTLLHTSRLTINMDSSRYDHVRLICVRTYGSCTKPSSCRPRLRPIRQVEHCVETRTLCTSLGTRRKLCLQADLHIWSQIALGRDRYLRPLILSFCLYTFLP